MEMDISAIKEIMAQLTPEEKQEIDELILQDAPIWVPLEGPQTMAYDSKADIIGYGGAAGGGKMLNINDLALTPKGFVKFGSLKVGDSVTDPITGGSTKVIGIFPQGVKSLYRFTFDDGAVLDTGLEHLWRCRPNGHTHKKPNSKPSKQRNFAVNELGANPEILEPRGWRVASTQDIINDMDNGVSVRIPLTAPVAFTKYWTPWKTDPYLIGLFLGDGNHQSFTITNVDQYIGDYLLDLGFSFDGEKDYRMLPGKEKNRMRDYFKSNDQLICRSWEKFIPNSLKFGAIDVRLAVLQGLMDTDGTVDHRGRCYYTSVSKQLAEDVQFIVRSLGGKARIKSRVPSYTHKGKKKKGRIAYTVRCWLPKTSALFRLPRKKERCTDSWNGGYDLTREIVSYEEIGEAECVCIAVDSPDSLYIAGKDLIVTHNTDLACGLALTRHKRSIIYRREGTQLSGILQRFEELVSPRKGPAATARAWKPEGTDKIIEYGGVNNLGDEKKYQGKPHDLKVFDEVTEFLEAQVRFLCGWLRSEDPNIHSQILMTFNPPTTAEGRWVLDYFAPWLKKDHPNPAKPGELRWFTTDPKKKKDIECDGPEPVVIDGELVKPVSRTFIPAKVEDNPYYMDSGYKAILQALPEPLRSQMLKGDFMAGIEDDPFQIIPTKWVELAVVRWHDKMNKADFKLGAMDSMGVDVARGGIDKTIISTRYGSFFPKLVKKEGAQTPNGPSVASEVILVRRDGSPVHIDVIGWGASAYDFLVDNNIQTIPVNSSESSYGISREGDLPFFNLRAELWWKMREALDPINGDDVCLPPDPELMSELCAAKWEYRKGGIKVESKEEIKKRIGRSTDNADAVIMCNIDTMKDRDLDLLAGGDKQFCGGADDYD